MLDHLKKLYEINVDLAKTSTFHDLCYQIVALGRQHLGFDRIGLVLWDQEAGVFKGTVSTNRYGTIIDQRSYSQLVINDPRVADIVASGEIARYWESISLTENGRPVGTGWFAIALLFDGNTNIGWIATDNLIHQAPFSIQRVELLALYANSVGHLLAQKLAQEAAVYSDERLREMIDQSPFAIIEYDLGYRVMSWNPAAEELFGYGKDEILGKQILNKLAPKELHQDIKNLLDTVSIGSRSTKSINQNVTKNGTVILCEWVNYPLSSPTGQIIGYGAITQDVTLREEAERQRISLQLEQQKVELLQTFMDNITHEFKTPLTTIQTSLHLLERYKDEAQRKGKLKQIREQTSKLEDLVQNLLTLSRLHSLPQNERKPLDINEIVNAIIKSLNPIIERKSLEIFLRTYPKLPTMLGDYEAIHSALTNLLVNAIHYTPEKCQIHIETQIEDNSIMFIISDQGIGIAREELDHIFERHFRSENARSVMGSGSGLGLAIVKRAVEIHNGEITVESELNQGTKFSLRFPLG